jgi:hypothetical protein
MALLKSDWGSLSPHLMATWFPVKMQQDGNTRSFRAFGDTQVMAPITDANLEQTQNWTSPFENMTADSGMSTFSAMLQVGGFGAILNALQKHVPNGSAADSALSAAQEQANSLTGSTSITKLNSTQIYNGSPPLKITLTAHFRALRDPVKEVKKPVNQLMEWSMADYLAPDGFLTNLIESGNAVRSVYPSRAPSIIGMIFRGCFYMPMVIESMSKPLDHPITTDGQPIVTSLQMTLASLTALDRSDWKTTTGG